MVVGYKNGTIVLLKDMKVTKKAQPLGAVSIDQIRFANSKVLVVRAGPDFYKVDIESLKVTLAVKSSNIFAAPGELSTISL